MKKLTFAERASDKVASVVGSWRFIVVQSILLTLWIAINTFTHYVWDAPPYIGLNLLLSFQAAFTAPIIMMAQNRQSIIDRKKAEHDYRINEKAEKEIADLHIKFDKELTMIIQKLSVLQKKK